MRSLEFQCTVVVSLAPSQNDRGDVEWHYWGSAEAGKCRSRFCWKQECCGCSCSYFIVYHNCLVFVKFIKNCIFIYDKLTGERSFSVHLVAASLPIIVIS